MRFSKLFFTIFISLLTLSSCGVYKKVDQRQMPDGAEAKGRKSKTSKEALHIGFEVLNS